MIRENRISDLNDKYFNHKEFILNLNFTKESILTSNINSKNGLNLPSYYELDYQSLDYVINEILNYFQNS